MKNVCRFVVILQLIISLSSITTFGQNRKNTVCLPWTWIMPLITNRNEIETSYGATTTKDKSNPYQTYVAEFGKINVLFAPEKKYYKEYDKFLETGTVVNYFVSPQIRFAISELPYDLTLYDRDATYSPRELGYYSEKSGIMIGTEIVVGEDGSKIERVRSLEYRAPLKNYKK